MATKSSDIPKSSHQVLAEINNGQVTREWRDIAFHLKVSKTKIYEIETQAKTQNYTLQWILISVVEEWMRGCEEPTWEQLANALESAGISQVAYTIRQKYTVNNQQARVQSDNSGCSPITPRDQKRFSSKIKKAKHQLSDLDTTLLKAHNTVEREVSIFYSEAKHLLDEECAHIKHDLKKSRTSTRESIDDLGDEIDSLIKDAQKLVQDLQVSVAGLERGRIDNIVPAKKAEERQRIKRLESRLQEIQDKHDSIQASIPTRGVANCGDSEKLLEELIKVLIQFDSQPAIMPEGTSHNMYSNTTYENCRIESDSGYVTLHPN